MADDTSNQGADISLLQATFQQHCYGLILAPNMQKCVSEIDALIAFLTDYAVHEDPLQPQIHAWLVQAIKDLLKDLDSVRKVSDLFRGRFSAPVEVPFTAEEIVMMSSWEFEEAHFFEALHIELSNLSYWYGLVPTSCRQRRMVRHQMLLYYQTFELCTIMEKLLWPGEEGLQDTTVATIEQYEQCLNDFERVREGLLHAVIQCNLAHYGSGRLQLRYVQAAVTRR